MKKKTETNKTDPGPRIDAALLELVHDGLLSAELSDKITMRILGRAASAKPQPLTPDEIRHVREHANMSQAVFALILNVTTGYISQIERGVKRPTGPALAMLHVIKRKGVQAVM
jgi:putative transcriptional regulator